MKEIQLTRRAVIICSINSYLAEHPLFTSVDLFRLLHMLSYSFTPTIHSGTRLLATLPQTGSVHLTTSGGKKKIKKSSVTCLEAL